MAENKNIEVGGRLHSIATGNVLAGANEIQDDNLNKTQAQINEEVNTTLETYGSAIEGLNSQNYVSVEAYSELPELGSVNTVYRVSSWDGEQIDTTKYAEYAWRNTGIDQGEYVLLAVKNYGIDDVPTAGSDNLVKSEGIYNSLIGISEFVSVKEITELVKNVYFVGNTRYTTALCTRVLKNNGYKKIKVVVGLFSGTPVNAITFFSGATLEEVNVISYVSAILPSSGSSYETYVSDIPSNCTFIGITYNLSLTNTTVEVSNYINFLKNKIDDTNLVSHNKIAEVCAGYRNSSGGEIQTLANFNTGTSLFTPLLYDVNPGDILQFENPNNYLVAYWWFDENNSFISQIWYYSAGTSVSQVVPAGAKKVSLGFRLDAGLDFNTYQPVDIVIEPKKDLQSAIKDYILSEAFLITGNVVKDDNGIVSANIEYPDNKTGSFAVTRDSNGNVISAIYVYDSYSYTLSITRDSDGSVTSTSLTEN